MPTVYQKRGSRAVQVAPSTEEFTQLEQRVVQLEETGPYVLPVASETRLGGVKVDGVSVTVDGGGTISAPAGVPIQPADSVPEAPGNAAIGTSLKYARQDHVHPEQTVPLATAESAGLVKPGTAITVDGEGALSVSPESTPLEALNGIRKGFGILIPLTQAKNIYVNSVTGADTLDEGRGESGARPFKSIQAAINYAAATYSLGAYNLAIVLADGTCPGDVRLVRYTATTGRMVLRGNSADTGAVSIEGCVYADMNVGTWDCNRVTIRNKDGAASPGSSNFYGVLVKQGASVTLNQCAIDVSGKAPDGKVKEPLYAAGGQLEIRSGDPDIPGLTIVSKGDDAPARLLHAEAGGSIAMLSDIAVDVPEVKVASLYLSGGSRFYRASVFTGHTPTFSGTTIGKRYDVRENSIASTLGGGPDFIPGDAEGTVGSGGQYT